MSISSAASRLQWSPYDEAAAGRLLFRVQGEKRASGRPDVVPFAENQVFIAPANEGSRSGDGRPNADPYAYENDGVTSVDYRPLVVSGVLPSTNALGFTATSGPGSIGAFVDDPNTGVASQAPNQPGKLMVLSRDRQGSDYGLFSGGIKQPKTLVLIARYTNLTAAFGPALELNGSVLTDPSGERTDLFLVQGYRITANAGGTGTPWFNTLDVPPTINTWYTIIWRLEAANAVAYEGLTGALRASTQAGGAYDPDEAIVNDPAVHSLGGRRYSFAGAAGDARTRNFSSLHIQDLIGIDRLVDPVLISKWIRFQYPGIENVAEF